MLRKVGNYIRLHKLLNPGDTVIVAVSGGADSVALLDVLASLKPLSLRLIVAHLNHCLRGAESDADEAFVCKLAQRYGTSFVTSAVDVKTLSRQEKLSLEEAGRIARYRFFGEIATSCNARCVAVAHHADDQAETVLMRLIRGTGGSGLVAMSPGSGSVIRPLLAVTRAEIENYLEQKGLQHRIDQSNTDLNFLRNRIRHELIPFLKNYNPAIAERLATTAEALSEDERILESVTTRALRNHAVIGAAEVTLAVAGTDLEPPAIRIRMYRQAVQQLKGDLSRVGSTHLYDIDALLMTGKPNGRLNLSDGIVVVRRYGQMVFSRENEVAAEPYALTIEGPGSYVLPGGGVLTIDVAVPPRNWLDVPEQVAYIDGDAVPFPWQIRTFAPGDSLVPLGMERRKKVKNVFIDRKVPLVARRRIPLFFSGETLFWIGGIMLAASGRLTASTSLVLKVEITGCKA